MPNEQTKTNTEFNKETNPLNPFGEVNADDFRNTWGDERNPHMGYGPGYGGYGTGYGYPSHHQHWMQPGYGYGHPYGYHHYGMYGPGYGYGMYGGYHPYGMHHMYGGYPTATPTPTPTPTPYQRAFDPTFFSAPYGVGFPQQGFNGTPYGFPQGAFPGQEFAAQQTPTSQAGNVSSQVIQGTATPVRKARPNSNSNN